MTRLSLFDHWLTPASIGSAFAASITSRTVRCGESARTNIAPGSTPNTPRWCMVSCHPQAGRCWRCMMPTVERFAEATTVPSAGCDAK